MKSIFLPLLLFALSLPAFINAQTEGLIHYKEVIKLDVQLPDDMDPQIKAMIPTEQSSDKTLYFTANESLYKNREADQEAATESGSASEDGQVRMKMIVQRSNSQFFVDHKGRKKVHLRDFMGKKFLINDDLRKRQWKIGNEQKSILGYTCMKAVLQDTGQVVEAWFSPQIPAQVGPSGFDQLPGAILAVNIDGGRQSMTATAVELKPLDEGIIQAPTKGKKVSQKELDEIIAKKRKEMGATSGSGNVSVKLQMN
ncbi:MAG: GLPGLI family protein [Bacteroidota bacterium]